jgi:YQGE family putative transporter
VYPLIGLFVNAFILRQTNDFVAVAIYNLGTFFAIPIGFYLNGFILKRHPIALPFLFGMVGQAVVACLVFFFSFQSWWALFAFGLLQGIPMGLYWGNRNFINLQVTHDESRNYFTGLEMILYTIASTTMPLIVGWTIALGGVTQLYSASFAYQLLGLLAIVFMYAGGRKILSAKLDHPKFEKLWIRKPSVIWTTARLVEVFRGLQNAIDLFLIPLVIFHFLGREGLLGTLQSIAAAMGVIILYGLARFLTPRKRIHTLFVNIVALIAISLIFAIGFSQVTALIYVLFAGTIHLISWLTSNPISMRTIDEEDGGDNRDNYAYVCDRELFLNVGRAIGIGVFIVFIHYTSQQIGLRFIPLVISLSQLLFFWLVSRLDRVQKA